MLCQNRVGVPPARDVLDWLQDHPGAVDDLQGADSIAVLSGLRQYRLSAEELTAVTAEIATRAKDVPVVRNLMTIPAVSLLTARHLYAYIGARRRLTGPKQVARCAGLDPSVQKSGQTDRRGRTSKHGCGPLRTALMEAAHVTASWDNGPLGQFFRRARQKVGYNKSITALATKLLNTAWKMMLTGEPYAGARPETTRRRLRHVEHKADQGRNWSQPFQELLGCTPAMRMPPAHTQNGRSPRKEVRPK